MYEVLYYTENMEAATDEIENIGGLLRHRLSSQALVAALPNTKLPTLAHCSTEPTDVIDEDTRSIAGIWKACTVPRSPSPTEGMVWNAPTVSPPGEQRIAGSVGEPEIEYGQSTGTPTSLYMAGKIVAGIVTVDDSSSGTTQFSDDEKVKLREEVLRACQFLASVEPRAKIEFAYDFADVSVSLPAEPLRDDDPYEKLEAPWRDAAMKQLGFPEGRSGYQQYLQQLIDGFKSKWGFLAFFTKLPTHHFAYAIWEKVVMQYENDGWGPDNIHRVFAHEVCHIFGAADEYGGCQCGTLHGYLQAPNNNCVNCFTAVDQQVPCLMDRNTLALCEHTRKQIGWGKPLIDVESEENAAS